MHTKFWSENLKGGDHLGDLRGNQRITLKYIFEKQGGIRIEYFWLRTGSSSGLL